MDFTTIINLFYVMGIVRIADTGWAITYTYCMNSSSVISVNPGIMHGTPCFAGTRVAISTFFDHVEAGYAMEDFLREFPTVKREQVVALLSELRDEVAHRANAA